MSKPKTIQKQVKRETVKRERRIWREILCRLLRIQGDYIDAPLKR